MEAILLLKTAELKKKLSFAGQSFTGAADQLTALAEASRMFEEKWEGQAGEQWEQEWLDRLTAMKEQIREAGMLTQQLRLAANQLIETEKVIIEMADGV